MATPDGYSGLLRTTPDGYSILLRMATPATGVLGILSKASLNLGKPPTRRPVSPVPVPSPSTIVGLGRDSSACSSTSIVKKKCFYPLIPSVTPEHNPGHGHQMVAVMGVGSQQNTSVTVNIIYWGASPERRHIGLFDSTHTFHQALEEIISERIALKPRLFIHSYDYIQYYTSKSGLLRTSDGYFGWLLQMATPDYSGLLRMATPYYSGWLRRPQGFSVSSPRPA